MEWTRREREALARELAGKLRGQVRFEEADRALYSTDASLYQILPIGAVVPADEDDAAEAIRICLAAGAPVIPRGSGTSLAGQTIGRAVIVDVSKKLDGVLSIDAGNRRAVVQPGLIQSHLNAAAGRHGLLFGPDTASATRATLGGMVGNNSAGSYSILFKKTVDHVRWLDVVLSDGTRERLGPVPLAEAERRAQGGGVLGSAYRAALKIRAELADEIRTRFPKIMRRVSGYNLDELLHPDRIDLARLIVGSEGSLATVLRMEVDLVEAPRKKGLAVLHFSDLVAAVAATTTILRARPAAVELLDELLMDLARKHPTFAAKLWFARPETRAVLLVEFWVDDEAELEARFADLARELAADGFRCPITRAETAAQANDAWAVRKAGLPLLASIPTKRKPLEFVEDTAVAPDKLPAFVKRFQEVVARHGTQAAYYAHASAGCLHIRPLLDLHDAEDRARMAKIAEEVFHLVMEFGGSMSGEHGDGRSRSHFNERHFGSTIYNAFKTVKAAFDPSNLFNPGQVVDGPPMLDDLRWDFTANLRTPPTVLDWSETDGGMGAALESCNGTALCRKLGEGTMCPSFMATRDEEDSTRGRADLLRSALSGALSKDELFGPAMDDAMRLCLMCKACKSECPVKVDMAKMKAEWLSWRHQERGTPLSSKLLGNVHALLGWGSLAPGLANWAGGTGVGRWLAERVLGFDSRRPLPRLAARDFAAAYVPGRARGAARGPAVLLVDTFSRYLDPRPALDAAALLEAAGHEVVPLMPGCCGRPAFGQGLLSLARAQAGAMVAALEPYASKGIPIVGVEPGCLSMLWDDAGALVPGEATRTVKAATRQLEAYLLELGAAGVALPFQPLAGSLGIHPHCHQEALGRGAATPAALALVPGLEVKVLGGGCCGMAGEFGFLEYETSRKVFANTRTAKAEGTVCAPGSSCRTQIRDLASRTVLAPASVLRASLDGAKLPV